MNVIHVLCLLGVYLATLALAMWWLFRSGQTAIAGSPTQVVLIAVKLALVLGGIVAALHYLLGVPQTELVVLSIVMSVWGSFASSDFFLDDDVGGNVFTAMLVVPFAFAREFILGFPIRKRLVLEPEDAPHSTESIDDLREKTGVVTASLRPSGVVTVDDSERPARSADGSFVETGSRVTVCGVSGSSLIVNRLEES